MKPILFNTEMVKAILEGRKTVTRRVINRDIADWCDKEKDGTLLSYENSYGDFINPVDLCRYRVGDILYVRETWCKLPVSEYGNFSTGGDGIYYYKADGEKRPQGWRAGWKPSIHMPKEAARLFLRVTGVRVERLQDITEVQATKEGCKAGSFEYKGAVWGQEDTDEWTAVEDFANVWQSTIKKDQLNTYGWNANPYVWVIEFEDISEDIKNGRV